MIGTEGARLLRNSESKETPQAQLRRGGSRTARGKRVPEVKSTSKFVQSVRQHTAASYFFLPPPLNDHAVKE
ncbi:hypothetical protein KEH51_21205 [[Brevibacterium] frigoritolerans]|uniref:Uncharacterized protein n=1 Tax=Peribacillus frigoritolerans TaxID=450367 RepID=A0A941FT31_9BACI|nr:hypothetical protein [Peribacillus frigoritolerans]